MRDPAADPGVPGKKLLPMLAVGCLVFCLVMGFGMFFVAKWTTPFFEHLAKQHGHP